MDRGLLRDYWLGLGTLQTTLRLLPRKLRLGGRSRRNRQDDDEDHRDCKRREVRLSDPSCGSSLGARVAVFLLLGISRRVQ